MSKLNRTHAIALAAVMALAIAVPFAIAQSKDAGGQRWRHAEGREHGMRGGRPPTTDHGLTDYGLRTTDY